MSGSRQQGKNTMPTRRSKRGKNREPTPEPDSDSGSPERSVLSNTSSRDRRPDDVPKKGYSDPPYPRYEAASTSVKSTPPKDGSLYPYLGPSPHSDAEMSRSHLQRKTTTSPGQTRRDRDRECTPSSDSDSEEYQERNRISNTGEYKREPFNAPKKSHFEPSDAQYGPDHRHHRVTPDSIRSTPPSDRRQVHLESTRYSGYPSQSFTSSPGSFSKSPGSPSSEQGIYPDIKKRFSDDDTDNSPTYFNQQDRKGFWHGDQDLNKRRKALQKSQDSRSQIISDKYLDRFDEDNRYASFVFIFLIIVAIMAVVWVKLSSSGSDSEKGNYETQPLSQYDLFSNDIKELRHHFPSQKDRLWRSVIASSRHILKEPNSTYPSVILLASQVESPRLSFCIAEKIAFSFVKSHGISPGILPTTNVDVIKDFEASEQKLKLDRDIQTALDEPSGKAYIIQNLQMLSPQAALLLHGLCDGDNAPYKDVMILMTLELPKTMPAKTAHEIENYLTNLWTTPQVEYDKVSAVMSRISNNLVIIQHENPASVGKVCADF